MKSGYALVSSILVMASQKLTNCCVPAIALVTAVYCPPKPETSKSALQNRRDAPRQAPYFCKPTKVSKSGFPCGGHYCREGQWRLTSVASFRSGGGFFVAPSSFDCFVGGRTRVFLLWKGVDVLLGKTFQPSGKTEIASIHSSSKAIHQTPRGTQLPIWLPHIPRVLRSCDAFQIAAAVIPGTDHSRMQSWRQPIFRPFLW